MAWFLHERWQLRHFGLGLSPSAEHSEMCQAFHSGGWFMLGSLFSLSCRTSHLGGLWFFLFVWNDFDDLHLAIKPVEMRLLCQRHGEISGHRPSCENVQLPIFRKLYGHFELTRLEGLPFGFLIRALWRTFYSLSVSYFPSGHEQILAFEWFI